MRIKNTATELLLVAIAMMLKLCAAISHLTALTVCKRPRSAAWLPMPLKVATVHKMVYPKKSTFKQHISLVCVGSERQIYHRNGDEMIIPADILEKQTPRVYPGTDKQERYHCFHPHDAHDEWAIMAK